MEQDKFALVEKILKDVDNVMSKNAELYMFDIVPVESNFHNKSPVLHLENCLGLEAWCVKHVYLYCYTELIDKYFTKPKRKALKISSINSDRLISLLNITLLLNPELGTLWNKRKELVLKSLLEKTSELHFTKLVLSRKPKCNDAFSYRRWLLDIVFQDDNLQSNCIESLISEELNICQLASDKSPNNYHSWNHRMWLINKLKNVKKFFNIHQLYMKEYEFSDRWTAKHISDFSCFHYRQFCIKNIFSMDTDENWKNFKDYINSDHHKTFINFISTCLSKDTTFSENNLITYSHDNLLNLLLGHSYKSCKCDIDNYVTCKKLEILFQELVLNDELLRFYKDHETLWYHRRFIVHGIFVIIYDYFGLLKQNGILVKDTCKKCNVNIVIEKQAKIVRYDSNRIYSSNLFKIILNHEKQFIEEMRNTGDNYSDRHEKYLKYVEGINN